MKRILLLIVAALALSAVEGFAETDFNLEMKDIHRQMRETRATSATALQEAQALQEIERLSDSDYKKVPYVLVFAISEDRADAIVKAITHKLCDGQSCPLIRPKKIIGRVGDRDMLNALQGAYRQDTAIVGIDSDIAIGGGSEVKIRQIVKKGGSVEIVEPSAK